MRSGSRLYWLLVLPALLQALSAYAQLTLPLAPPVYAHLQAAPINEMSGIVKSRRRDNVYWVHNDSGDSARIFAITADGHSILPTYSKFTRYGDAPEDGKLQWEGFEVLNATNVDWEDIAADEHYLYVADVGNNGNARRDLVIYLLSEIDPTASTRSAVVKKLPVIYPEQDDYPPSDLHFDCESLFVDNGTLYLITKHRAGPAGFNFAPGAHLYRLDTSYEDRSNLLNRVDTHPTLLAATGADLSPDGSTLAVIAYTDLWLFARPASGDKWLTEGQGTRYPLDTAVFRQAEAIAWQDADSLLITNEQGDLFRLRLSELPAPAEP